MYINVPLVEECKSSVSEGDESTVSDLLVLHLTPRMRINIENLG
jgi:hypothetical protein